MIKNKLTFSEFLKIDMALELAIQIFNPYITDQQIRYTEIKKLKLLRKKIKRIYDSK